MLLNEESESGDVLDFVATDHATSMSVAEWGRGQRQRARHGIVMRMGVLFIRISARPHNIIIIQTYAPISDYDDE
ncbi:hypothetical protein DPMN_084462 [Dreissena polymorpha]|uniref:Uncharacterized protein n=1 Tax=Dreissena polymorpha TaxID=45954 RepID=A0A9D3YAT1_DREPO|nr:hypothetical protein DPMN_084462 [Dreissena polymorpha]